jgi:hypothetical protein
MGRLSGLALLVFVAPLGGCSSSDDTSGSKAPLDYVLHSTVVDENSQVVEGVEICAEGHSEVACATTDALGIADIALPKNTDIVITYAKDGFITKRRQHHTTGESPKGIGTWFFQRRSWYEQVMQDAGASPGAVDLDQRGLVSLQTGQSLGLSFTLDPQSSDNYGPFHACIQGAKLVYCPEASQNDSGVVGFANLQPGKYRGIITKDNVPCTAQAFACGDGTPGCVELEVQAGKLTHGWLVCQ